MPKSTNESRAQYSLEPTQGRTRGYLVVAGLGKGRHSPRVERWGEWQPGLNILKIHKAVYIHRVTVM